MLLTNSRRIAEKIKVGVVVRGTGIHAAKCSYLFSQLGIHILCFAEVNRGVDKFRGKTVYDISEIPYKNAMLVIATKIDTYCDISDELRSSNMKEFNDFIYYEWLLKDIVLLHGNCHMEILGDLLCSSPAFTDRYTIYPYPLLISSTKQFRTEPEIFENIDVWIHEDIRQNNVFGYEVSDEYIRKNLGINVLEIRIPHLYGISKMFFPQVVVRNDGNNEALNGGRDTDGIFLYGDKVIESCISRDMKLDDIIEFCKSDEAIPKHEIFYNYERCMSKVRNRERSWDVKVSSFIEEKYKHIKLFYDPGHPTNVIMEYIAKEVLKKLGAWMADKTLTCSKSMDAHEKFVYPCVKKALGIVYEEKEIRKTGKRLSDHMDFSEFIREYCWWRYYENYKDQL